MCHTISFAMEDLRLWFLETRICRLWPNIVEESWAEFLAEDNRRAKRTLLEFLDSSHNHDILYFTRSAHMEERQVTHQTRLEMSTCPDKAPTMY